MAVVTDKRYLTLLALALAGGEPLDGVHLQKAVFLLQNKLPSNVLPRDGYHFIKHDFGPFDRQIYADAFLFAEQGLAISRGNSRKYEAMSANEHGKKRAFGMLEKMPLTVALWAADIVTWVQSQHFERLVPALYDEYPTWKENSKFRGLINRFIPHSTPNPAPSTRNIPKTHVVDEERVSQFLEEHPFLLPLVVEARAQLNKSFPDAQVSLEVSSDPESDEGDENLVLSVQTDPKRDDALERLRQFDKSWWLGKIREAQGMLAITLSYQ
ncbi:MAG TPA: hypothetical protein VF914_15055 [Chloroflexia bacterium]